MKKKITIAIVDDHELFTDGLEVVLSQIEDFEIVSKASNGREFLEQIELLHPDIVLMDISMPEMDGIETTQRVLAKFPDLKIITLSSYGDDVYYYKMIKAGAHGFVQKKSGKKELETAIRTVFAGNNYFPHELMRKIIFKIGNQPEGGITNIKVELSKREKEVLVLICQGFSNKEIAEKLFISPNTVDNHRSNLLSKTSTRNAAHLVLFAIKEKLIEI
ncbi:MAG: response regulator transcription factor [Marinilabiliaceae bacterium]|nr:response regulator transcription factor [Marinilabiliaceae bacterium]